MTNIGEKFLTSAILQFRKSKELADAAIAQVPDEALRKPLSGDANSIAIIMKHMAGNMRSRWTDFLTSDGEKPWRNRDAEFIDGFTARAEILEMWEVGWNCCFSAVQSLKPSDLTRNVTIRGQPLTVVEAVLRQIEHYGYHVGQIIMVARIHVGAERWQPLTIPSGRSREHNRSLGYDP